MKVIASKKETKRLVIMRGLPGSGKSTLAKSIYDAFQGSSKTILSTDAYWLRPDGTYDFNSSLLPQAHAWNFRRFEYFLAAKEILSNPEVLVIIDNTNVRKVDYQKYVDSAILLGYTVDEVTPETSWAWDVETCTSRNIHGVPRSTIQRMADNFER